jgi:serine/threonine-protein kinase
MDFGIARSGSDLGHTVTGTTLGSLAYMSPEQVNCGPIDARSYLYSVGVSLYEMVTGQKPFKGESNFAIMQAQLQQPPRPPVELSANLPPSLNQIILKALSKEPAQRFQSAEEFRNALKGVAASLGTKGATMPLVASQLPGASLPAVAAPTMQMPPPASKGGGHRGLYISLGAAIVLVVMVAAGFSAPWFKTRANGGRASQKSGIVPATPGPSPVPDRSNVDVANPNESPAQEQTAAPDARPVPSSAAKISKTKSAASQAAGEQPAETQAAPEPPRPDPVQLAQLDHEIDQMSSRATAVNASLDNLQREQNANGMHLRGDMVAAQQRMQAYLSRAQSALQAQDSEGAQKYLELAELELGKIEKFLGH